MKICIDCGTELEKSTIRKTKRRCENCVDQKRIDFLLSEEKMNSYFSKKWSKEIFLRYYHFLNENGISKNGISRNLSKAREIFLVAEQQLIFSSQINEDWLTVEFNKMKNLRGVNVSLVSFLIRERILLPTDVENDEFKKIEKKISLIPDSFKRLIEIYFNEKRSIREKQIGKNASNPLSIKTIQADIEVFTRFVKWIMMNCPEVTFWGALKEEHVNSFLLSLTDSSREIVRKDLFILFKLAKKKRVITHIPLMDRPTREYPRSLEALDNDRQKELARIISNSFIDQPTPCLLAILCFYHGFSSKTIRNIKIQDIDLERKCIHVDGRPPAYLLEEDLLILQKHLEERSKIRNIKNKTFLFVTKSFSYDDLPVSKNYILISVKKLTGYSPKILKITCFTALAAIFGPQYLIEAFGVSLTQASRYGKMEEFLIDEEIHEQRDSLRPFIFEKN